MLAGAQRHAVVAKRIAQRLPAIAHLAEVLRRLHILWRLLEQAGQGVNLRQGGSAALLRLARCLLQCRLLGRSLWRPRRLLCLLLALLLLLLQLLLPLLLLK